MGLNIRIIKLGKEFLAKGYLGDNPYRYLVTEGYRELDDDIKIMVIEFCPFCGRELRKIYNTDEYVNELKHHFV